MDQQFFTLQELNELRNDQYLLSEQRFRYYFTHLYGWTDEQCAAGFTVFKRFPYCLHDEDYPIVATLLPLVKKVLSLITPVHRTTLRMNRDDYAKRKIKVIYLDVNHCRREMVIDLCRAEDIITYGELLKCGIEIIAQLEYVESIRYNRGEGEEIDVYEGDIFMTESGLRYAHDRCRTKYILCTNETYYPLLYTEGKGYVRDGEPDYDKKEARNFHVITLEESYKRVGNMYIDFSFLVDNNKLKTK